VPRWTISIQAALRSDEEAWAQGPLGTRRHRVVFRLGYFLNRLDGSPK